MTLHDQIADLSCPHDFGTNYRDGWAAAIKAAAALASSADAEILRLRLHYANLAEHLHCLGREIHDISAPGLDINKAHQP